MSYDPDLDDPGRLRRLQEWWLALTLGRRVNVMLYGLAGVAGLFLLGSVLTGGDEPNQVASGGSTTSSVAPTSTTSRPSTTQGPTTTSLGVVSTQPTTTVRSTITTRPGSTQTTASTTTTTAAATTTAPPNCSNSSNPACGEFRWDPAPAANQPLTVTITPSTSSPAPGQAVSFTITVNDPDHLVDGTCSVIDWGDGSPSVQAPCPHPPACPAHFGPWTPPPAQPGNFSPIVPTHSFAAPGTYNVLARYFSVSQDRCNELDPYRSTGEKAVTIVVATPTTTTSSTTIAPTTTTSTTSIP